MEKYRYNFLENKIFIKLISCILILILSQVIDLISNIKVYADTLYQLETNIYTSSTFSGTNVALTETGCEVTGWNYDESRFLLINPNVPNDNATYTITVEMAKIMYVNTSQLTTPSGYDSVNFTKNSSIVCSNNYTYTLKPYSGTIEYQLSQGVTRASIGLELRYDTALWNRKSSTYITKSDVIPITVKLKRNGEVISTKKISKIKSKNSISMKQIVAWNQLDDNTRCYESLNGLVNQRLKCSMSIISGFGISLYEKINFELTLPKYIYNGNSYYLEPDLTTLTVCDGYRNYTLDTSKLANGKLNIEVNNIYLPASCYLIVLTYKPVSQKVLDLYQGVYTFSAQSLRYTFTFDSGATSVFTKNWYATTFYEQATPIIGCKTPSNKIAWIRRPDDVAINCAGFYIQNSGLADTNPLRIDVNFDILESKNISVFRMNIFGDNVSNYITVTYSLVDEYAERVYLDSLGNRVSADNPNAVGTWNINILNNWTDFSRINNLMLPIATTDLPENQRQYYFKSLSWNVAKIRKETRQFYYQNDPEPTGAGNVYGIKSKIINTNNFTSKITITDTITNDIIESIYAGEPSEQRDPPMILSELSANKTSINAGDNFRINGTLQIYHYPYSTHGYIIDSIVGVVLPYGMVINEDAITFTLNKNNDLVTDRTVTVASRDLGNGNNLFTLYFPSEIYLGFLNKYFETAYWGDSLNFSIQVDSSISQNSTRLVLNQIVFGAGIGQTNSINGSRIDFKAIDIYDLNQNGSTTDYIASSNDGTGTIEVKQNNTKLEVENKVTLTSNGVVSNEVTNSYFTNPNDTITYNLKINCKNGGYVENFKYFIPIPKINSGVDSNFVGGNSSNRFDMMLSNFVSIIGSNVFEVMYTKQTGLTYALANSLNDSSWISAQDLTLDELSSVTCIKLTTKNNSNILNGENAKISLSLKFMGTSFIENCGKTNTWKTTGYYHYYNNGRELEGNFSTEPITVSLKYSKNLEDITLLAKPRGNANVTTINSSQYPEFINSHTFRIKSVQIYNAVLREKSYIVSNSDTMSGENCNKTFAITVKLNSGEEKDILNTANSTPILIGTTNTNERPIFNFKIYNGNNISENTSARYIILTLVSDEGLTFTQKINITREIARPENPESEIASGKKYDLFSSDEQLTITNSSCFTAQFVNSYFPNQVTYHELEFKVDQPVGTRITLIDLSNTNPNIYFKDIKSDDVNKKKIRLTDFINLGTTNISNFYESDSEDRKDEKLLVIVDYKNSISKLENGQYFVKMTIFGNDGIDDILSSLDYTISNNRTFGFKINNTENENISSNINGTLNIKYNSNIQSNTIDSENDGKKYSLVLSVPNDFPKGVEVEKGSTKYYLNNQNKYIIPLEDLDDSINESEIRFITNLNQLPNIEKSYNINLELYISNSNGLSPFDGSVVGSKSLTLTTNSKKQASIKISESNGRIIRTKDLNKNYSINLNLSKDNTMDVKCYLMKKDGTGYTKVTNVLNQINGNVNHNYGIYDMALNNGANTINLKFSSFATIGTYMIVFEVYDQEELINTTSYNYIVI